MDETFYGDIDSEDLKRFFACAGEALRTFGFRRFSTLHPGTDWEQELWGMGDLTTDGIPPHVISIDGQDVDLRVNWLELVGGDADTDAILEALKLHKGKFDALASSN